MTCKPEGVPSEQTLMPIVCAFPASDLRAQRTTSSLADYIDERTPHHARSPATRPLHYADTPGAQIL